MIANVVVATTAVITACHGISIYKQQRTTSDIKLALEIFETINRYWDRIIDRGDEKYEYNMGQILSQFEVAARLFNDSILTKEALPILKDHIIETYTQIKSHPDGKAMINSLKSSQTTFEHLDKFLSDNHTKVLADDTYNNKP